MVVYDSEYGRHKLCIDGHLWATEPGIKLNDVWVSGGREWLMGPAVDNLAELKHFLEFEIQQSTEWQKEKANTVYDGVYVGRAEAEELIKKHIKFCERLLSIIEK